MSDRADVAKLITKQSSSPFVQLIIVDQGSFSDWLDKAPDHHKAWVNSHNFEGAAGQVLLLPDTGGKANAALVAVADLEADIVSPWTLGSAVSKLPAGRYRLTDDIAASDQQNLAIGWALEQYVFDRYKDCDSEPARYLILPDDADIDHARSQIEAARLVRDLINTPAEHMGPVELEAVAADLALDFDATLSSIIGDDLLAQNFPTIHFVGRAAEKAPRLLDMRWGDEDALKVTLVGKGVCFDTGGLNVKGGKFMGLMKKDMGGAAHVLGLARLIMAARLPVRLRVLIPAVENNIAGNSMRPGDVVLTRAGLSVEIGNTDAEGRLVLCDALSYACEEKPDILLDYATLTGAARVALGPDLPATFTDDDGLYADLEKAGRRLDDPIWRLPLWKPYLDDMKSPIADTNNISDGGFAGAITAALYLQRFTEGAGSWVHFDVYGWKPKPSSGRPKGGHAQAIRAAFDVIQRRSVS